MTDNPSTHLQKPSALEFLTARRFDLLVSVKQAPGETTPRVVYIHYYELGVCSCFAFNLFDRPYAGNSQQMLHASVHTLLTEVRSRALSGQQFNVWYFNPAVQAQMESVAAQLAQDEPGWQRAVDKLILVGRQVGDAAPDVP